MKVNPKSAWGTNVTIEWKGIQKCARYKRNNLMRENPSSAHDTGDSMKEKY